MYVTTKKRRVRRSPATWLAATAVLLGACGGSSDRGNDELIEKFEASPVRTCVGDIVSLTWDTTDATEGISLKKGTEIISSINDGRESEEISHSGRNTFTLRATTRWTWDEQDVVVTGLSSGYQETMIGTAHCVRLSDGLLYWQATINSDRLGSRGEVGTIHNPTPRTIMVERSGVSELIPAMGSSDRFAGFPATGSWLVTGELLSTETCTLGMTLQLTQTIECD